jgi:hypothetical protein
VPDWVLGGARRRLVFERLKEDDGWSAIKLANEIGGGDAWVFEIYRILRSVEALEPVDQGRYRLTRGNPLADALVAMLDALKPYRDTPVDRPPSRKQKKDS